MDKITDRLLFVFAGLFLGIYLESHYTQMFRSWDDQDQTLYRGDKVALKLKEPSKTFYRGCEAWFLDSQAVTSDNMAWVLLKNCAFQKPGFNGPGSDPFFEPLMTETFRLRDLERIK